MARPGKFIKDQLLPEDPMDWVIMLLMVGIIVGAIVIVIIMGANGYF